MKTSKDNITFNRHMPVRKTKQGNVSISGYGINRPELNRVREAYLQNVRNNKFLAGLNPSTMTQEERNSLMQQTGQPWAVIELLINTAGEFMKLAITDKRPFSSMVRTNFPDLV